MKDILVERSVTTKVNSLYLNQIPMKGSQEDNNEEKLIGLAAPLSAGIENQSENINEV